VMVGITGAMIGIVLQIGKPTDTRCRVEFIVPSISLTIILANLFVKTWRVWRIFDNKRLKRIQITNWDLFRMLLSLIFIEAILFIIWYSLAAPVPKPFFGDWLCSSPLESLFLVAIKGYKLLLLAFGAFLGYNIRNVQIAQFNESRHIAFSIYNILFILIIVEVITFNTSSLKVDFIVSSGGTLFIVWGIISTLFAPKLYVVYKKGPEVEKEGHTGLTGSVSSSKAGASSSRTMLGSHKSKEHVLTTQNSQSAFTSKSVDGDDVGFNWD